ncbi:MAG: hypothetical protein KDF65_04545 [Anaerolineae bacterium]|nr:hypothetical protein [Anaerolineae bacterium]
MRNATLEITISVETDETTVTEIKELFNTDPTLSEAVVTLLNQKLKAAGISDDLKVSLNRNRLHIKTRSTGGLNAQEWLEAGGFANS